jgi:hypothetical protein
VTVTIRFAAAPFSVRGPVLRHETCGSLVAAVAAGQHEQFCQEAGEAP